MEKLKQMKEALVGCVQTQIYGNMEKVDAQELGAAIDMIKDLAEAIYYCTITESMEKEEKEGKEGNGQHGMMYSRPMPMYHMPYPVEIYDPRYRERYMPGSMYAQSGGSGGGGSSSGGSGGSSGGNSGGGGGSSGGSSSGGSRNARGDGGYDASERGNNARGGGTRGYHEGMIPMPMDYYPMYNEGMMYERGGNQGGGGGGRGGNRNYQGMMRDPREGRSGERRKMYMEGKSEGKDKTKQMQELEEYMKELSSDLTEMVQDASPEEKQLLQQKISTLASKIK